MKSYTNLEQSLKLIELGIDVNTADMYYPNMVGSNNYPLPIECKRGLPLLSQEIPAWSLSALLRFFDDRSGLAKQSGSWFAYNNNISYCTKHYTDEIDAVFEMVIKLHELKKL